MNFEKIRNYSRIPRWGYGRPGELKFSSKIFEVLAVLNPEIKSVSGKKVFTGNTLLVHSLQYLLCMLMHNLVHLCIGL